jgi:hypothetical protein
LTVCGSEDGGTADDGAVVLSLVVVEVEGCMTMDCGGAAGPVLWTF